MTSRVRSGTFASLALSALVAACATEAPACTGCAVAVIVMGADADAILPPDARTSPGEQVSDLMFLKLADIGPGLNTVGDAGFQPRLARSWKFEDPRTLTFEIDPRARWQDGAPVTARDVAFTFSVYRDPLINANARPLLETIESVTARDERTAVFRFRRVYPEEFYDATHHMRVLPSHLLDSIPRARLASHAFARAPIGDGPYRFVSWKSGESIEFIADTAFFLGKPGINRVIFRIAPDVPNAFTQIVTDQADMLEYIGGPDAVARVKAAPQVRIETHPSASFVFLGFNTRDPKNPARPHPLFGDRDLRRALALSVDRRTLVQAILGEFGQVPVGPASRMTSIGSDTTIAQVGFDTTRAHTVLNGLGWHRNADGIRERGGRKLEFEILVNIESPNRIAAATILQEQFKRIGVKANIVTLEHGTFQNRTRTHNFDAAILNWVEDPSPASIRQTFVTPAYREANYGGYSNRRFDSLVEQALNARDTSAAHGLWRDAYATINRDAPAIWLYTPLQPTAIHKRYTNVTIQPQQWLTTLWTWQVPKDRMIERDRLGATPPRTKTASP